LVLTRSKPMVSTVDEDKTLEIEIGLAIEPVPPLLQDVRALLLGRVRGLFFRVMPCRRKKRWIVP
jgi:hypothetical protein